MNWGKENAGLYLALVGMFVIGSYFKYPYLQVLSVMSATVLTLSILWEYLKSFMDMFDKAFAEWMEGL